MKLNLLYILCLFLLTQRLSGQNEQIFYQTFDLSEQIDTLQFPAFDHIEIVEWGVANRLMIETRVSLAACNPSRRLVLPAAPYELAWTEKDKNWLFDFKNANRQPIKTMQNEVCKEVLKLKIYLPSEFIRQNASMIVRKDALTMTAR